MYAHLAESSGDTTVKQMVKTQLMRLDSLDEREKIRRVLSDYTNRSDHCAASWKEISAPLFAAGLRLDVSGTPLDPTNVPYRLIKSGCDVDLDEGSKLPRR
jgi:hypothetical protein